MHSEKKPLQEQTKMHDHDREDVGMGVEVPKHVVLEGKENKLLLADEMALKSSWKCFKHHLNEVFHFESSVLTQITRKS